MTKTLDARIRSLTPEALLVLADVDTHDRRWRMGLPTTRTQLHVAQRRAWRVLTARQFAHAAEPGMPRVHCMPDGREALAAWRLALHNLGKALAALSH
jgi:hypothetical protein